MFRYASIRGGYPALEYRAAGAITPKVGLLLKETNGLLAVASGTDKPTYVCHMETGAAVASGTIIPVTRVDTQDIFETELSAAGTSLKVGNKVTIASDGLRATATTTDGVLEIVSIGEDTAVGAPVRVRITG